MRTGAAAGHRGYFHETAFYASDEEFLDLVVPFFTAGLQTGEPVVSAFAAGNQRLVREVFGADRGICYLGGEAQYLRPASAVRAYRDLFGEYVAQGAQQIRVAGDVPHPGVGAPWDWWARYEAAVNRAYDDFPVWGICPYDTRTAPAQVLADVRRTHPHIADGDRHATNPDFEDPAGFLRTRRLDGWRDPLEQEPAHLELVNPNSGQARTAISAASAAADLTTEERGSLLVAVSEAVSNALTYGRPPVVVRAWLGTRRVVVTVTDTGDGPADPYVGLLPAHSTRGGGLGLWISHQVCTFVGLHHGPDGFTIRLLIGQPASQEQSHPERPASS